MRRAGQVLFVVMVLIAVIQSHASVADNRDSVGAAGEAIGQIVGGGVGAVAGAPAGGFGAGAGGVAGGQLGGAAGRAAAQGLYDQGLRTQQDLLHDPEGASQRLRDGLYDERTRQGR